MKAGIRVGQDSILQDRFSTGLWSLDILRAPALWRTLQRAGATLVAQTGFQPVSGDHYWHFPVQTVSLTFRAGPRRFGSFRPGLRTASVSTMPPAAGRRSMICCSLIFGLEF
jgi:hypothetical protein